MITYKHSVAQLFLHSALNGKNLDDYVFKELLIQKLNHLFVDMDEEIEVYKDSISNNEKVFSIISTYSEKIPDEAKFGVYCNCLQLGISRIIGEPVNEFFLLLSVGMKVTYEKDGEMRKIFSEMMLTFFGYNND